MNNWIYNTLHPEIYHGHDRRPPFFEGWYYRLTNAAQDKRYAIIPGVFLGENTHAFIQVLEGHTHRTAYHVFPFEQFRASRGCFEVRIGESVFTQHSLRLALDRPEPLGQIQGELTFQGVQPWPVRWYSPGIMGWYAWIPTMECYHGVLSFNHGLEGALDIEGQRQTFDGGRGYIEKDWGKSFPAGYIWFQSNHFETPGICLTASIAMIPWLSSAFRGMIVGLWMNGTLYRFATYTGAKTERLELQDNRVLWTVSDRDLRLEMQVVQARGGLIYGPNRHDMGKRVDETLDAVVDVRLSEKSGRSTGKVLFEGQGRHAGLEINGDIPRLLGK
jgi:tocopherol cyclase